MLIGLFIIGLLLWAGYGRVNAYIVSLTPTVTPTPTPTATPTRTPNPTATSHAHPQTDRIRPPSPPPR